MNKIVIPGGWPVTVKGQVTIPKPIRDRLGLTPGSAVKNVRPVVPWGPAGNVQVRWMSGRYDYWKAGYQTGGEAKLIGGAGAYDVKTGRMLSLTLVYDTPYVAPSRRGVGP